MADGPASSAWHPALMPNTEHDPVPTEGVSLISPDSPADIIYEAPETNTVVDSQLLPNSEPIDSHDAADAWSFKDEENAGDAWAVQNESQPREIATEFPVEAETSVPDGATVLNDTTDTVDVADDAQPPTTASQHASSMSFARTVSHDVPFNDDDDGDWSLSRSNTDPFKFMPASDRTNSFPVVPLMASSPVGSDDAPLPAYQALDVLEETEKDFNQDEERYLAGDAQDVETSNVLESPARFNHAPSRSIGGDIKEPEAEAFESRYEEGVPLISHEPQEQGTLGSSQSKVAEPFAGDENEDDFFTQVQSSDQVQDASEDTIRPLERKSTIQVIGATNTALSRQHTLEETFEEEEDSWLHQTEHESAGVPVGSDGYFNLNQDTNNTAATEDLSTKWQEAFAGSDDEDFLLEDVADDTKEDQTAFLGSDDEGLLDDSEDLVSNVQAAPVTAQAGYSLAQQGALANPYLPQTAAPRQPVASYIPTTSTPFNTQPPAPYNAVPFGEAPAPPVAVKTQSFADKAKGGYSSPYDLPTDLVNTKVKPRKPPSMQQLRQDGNLGSQPPPPPLRSTSMLTPGTAPPVASPPSSHGAHGAQVTHRASTTSLRSPDNFFEDLPITAKPRPSSRHSNRVPSPSQHMPPPGQPHRPSPLNNHSASQGPPSGAPVPLPGANLVAPERVSPYAAIPSGVSSAPPPSNASRYSPAPNPQIASSAAPTPVPASRYSPAPSAVASRSSSFNASTVNNTSQSAHPHLPRTSSPLAHFEMNSDKAHAGQNAHGDHDRRTGSSSYEPRLSRAPSLPPTREVDEEEDVAPGNRSFSAAHSQPPLASTPETRFSSVPPPISSRHASPPPSGQVHLSPQKRSGSNYAPQVTSVSQAGTVPPPRSQTQSPGATRGGRQAEQTVEPARRTSSYAPNSPTLAKSHHRHLSFQSNAVAPTDGRENDPLERWKGVPLVAWGVGGTIVTSFPKSIPRYAMNQTTPTILRTAGEVKVKNIKDIEPLQERLAKFPGPLKGKSKKKETLAWLAAGIDALERTLPDVSFHSQLSLEAKRAIERLLLWKLLRVFIEFDGTLEGTPAVDKAVRDILSQGTSNATTESTAIFTGNSIVNLNNNTPTSMKADGADEAAMELIRADLLKGNRETAVWSAVDKRLWGHAMLISHTVSPELYKQVAQEFVRKEVNYPGHANESMAALYKVLSGNYDDCVDELVPVHARAGLQLLNTESTSEPTRDAMDGLDKWRETLTLVLSNRSADDVRGLNALGKLLSSYGRAEAAHICFLFSRNLSIFGGLDDPNADFVLVGSDHHQQSDQFAKETEALQLSEVYEYGLSLSGTAASAGGAAHLAAYKLQLAITLGEYGYRDKALQYCDAIATAMTSQTKRSPYYHMLLEAAVDDLMTRLKQAPKEESGSWMSKPSMNKVSDSMWNRFNKFVAGDEDGKVNGAAEGENGPFARIATTPTLSRSPSVSNFEMYGASPGYSTNSLPASSSAPLSKYAPMISQSAASNPYSPASQYAPAITSPPAGRTSNEYSASASPYEPSYPGLGSATAHGDSHKPAETPRQISGYQPSDNVTSSPQDIPGLRPAATGYTGLGLQESPSIQPHFGGVGLGSANSSYGFQPSSFGYTPPSIGTNGVDHEGSEKDAAEGGVPVGYEPPSFQPYSYEPSSYEPPSYQPDAEPSAEGDAPKSKKKGIMDDDDDDIPALKSQDTKSKSDRDRENQEMFRKAAEEDAKRAAAQQSGKKGWGFGGWFGGGKKAESGASGDLSTANKPIRAKLGEASSFVYDPDLKRWINKKPGAENVEAKTATPPPPRAGPRSVSGTPPPPMGTPPPPSGRMSVPPPRSMPPPGGHGLSQAVSMENLGGGSPMARSVSTASAPGGGATNGPPSRPTTSMSNASSIDDLLSASAPRKPGQKKARKSGRYVDVMAK